MATPDSGDSNLPKELGNEVCNIINCVAIKGARGNTLTPSEREVPSTGFKETEVAQSTGSPSSLGIVNMTLRDSVIAPAGFWPRRPKPDEAS